MFISFLRIECREEIKLRVVCASSWKLASRLKVPPETWRCLSCHQDPLPHTVTFDSSMLIIRFKNGTNQEWTMSIHPEEKNVYLDHSGLTGYPGKRYQRQANMIQTSERLSHLGKSTFSLRVWTLAGAGHLASRKSCHGVMQKTQIWHSSWSPVWKGCGWGELIMKIKN